MWILFALGAALLASFNPIIDKRLLAETDVSVVAWAGQAFGLPLLALNLILFFGPFPLNNQVLSRMKIRWIANRISAIAKIRVSVRLFTRLAVNLPP